MDWTPDMLSRGRKMYEAGGLNLGLIASSLSVTIPELIGVAAKEGWNRRKVEKVSLTKDGARIARVRVAYEGTSQSVEQIAADNRMSPKTIRRLAKEGGWERKGRKRQGWKSLMQPNRRHHFNGYHGTNAVAQDARAKRYAPELLNAIKTLQRNDFAVYRIKGNEFMCGTKRITEEALMEKARRYS